MKTPAKAEKKKDTRFKPGQSGNPKGRPQGSRHKATMAALALLEGQIEELTQACVRKALDGDTVALRLCLERIIPAAKERTIALALPPTTTMEGVSEAFDTVMGAVAIGTITPTEAATFAGILEKKRTAIEATELEHRIRRLEENLS
jgi:hypothetical protein